MFCRIIFFAPELLNRFDGVVVYEPLTIDDLTKIAHLKLLVLAKNLKQRNIYLEITDEVASKIANDGYEPAFGARPMQRILDLSIGDVLGKAIISGEITDGDTVRLLAKEGKNEYGLEKVIV